MIKKNTWGKALLLSMLIAITFILGCSDKAKTIGDGNYSIEVSMEGGSGKAYVESPAKLTVKDGKYIATLTWSSPNYDYMLVGDEKFLPINEEGNSVFEVPVSELDKGIVMIGDTTAMSKPHEVEYTFTFNSDTIVAE